MIRFFLIVALICQASASGPFVQKKGFVAHRHHHQYENPSVPLTEAVLPRGGAAATKKKANSKGLTLSQKFLSLSGGTAAVGGLLTMFNWEAATTYFFPGLKDVTMTDPLKLVLGASMLGWSVGKFDAVDAGPEATKTFCKKQVFVFMPIVLYGQLTQEWDSLIWVALEAGYIYFGFMDGGK